MVKQYSFFPSSEQRTRQIETVDELGDALSAYLSAEQVSRVKRAYYYAEQAHEGQRRRSGEPYITHPLAVAGILSEMHMDEQSLLAALLHDVIEDTGISKDALQRQFGSEVAELVDGVSKLTRIEFESKAEAQAENFQKMAMAMARDIRVIIVKLADRLHNMRTLGVLDPAKRRRVARETLDIYAPIAQRLGMHNVRVEFEDLGFYAMYPMRSERIRQALNKMRGGESGRLVEGITVTLENCLAEEGFQARIIGREKHLYSIYKKMLNKKKTFSDILDIYAFRIVVDSVEACYSVLGVVHSLYKPVPGQFKDYIAIPKANGYQSLHTVLFGKRGLPIEVQIRTEEMEEMANIGIASHWIYKNRGSSNADRGHSRATRWAQSLLEIRDRAGDSMEFIENVKIDLFPDEVYVFTPRGEIMELPQGATAVDFAYAVHTDIGSHCIACRVNRQLAPLSEPLQSGQTIEVITSPGARPNPSWLQTVVTAKARSSIRHFLKHQRSADAIELGRTLLEGALAGLGSTLSAISEKRRHEFIETTELETFNDLLEQIGVGNRVALLAARQILQTAGIRMKENEQPMVVSGTEGVLVHFARCCYPVPGDPIIGLQSAERGVVIHRESCHNSARHRDHPERYMSMVWAESIDREFPVEIKVELESHRSMIAVLAARINSADGSIDKISVEHQNPRTTTVNIVVGVNSRVHLARLIKRLRSVPEVIRVQRELH